MRPSAAAGAQPFSFLPGTCSVFGTRGHDIGTMCDTSLWHVCYAHRAWLLPRAGELTDDCRGLRHSLQVCVCLPMGIGERASFI